MQLEASKRKENVQSRTLKSMDEDLKKFNDELNGVLSNAKHANNVIGERFYDIDLDQVSTVKQ